MWCKTGSALKFEGFRLLSPHASILSCMAGGVCEKRELGGVNVASTTSAGPVKVDEDSRPRISTPTKKKHVKLNREQQLAENADPKELWFVALMLPAELASRVNCVVQDLSSRFNTRVSTAAPHITLIAPFEATTSQLEHLRKDLREFSVAQAPIDVQLQGFNSFGKRVLYADVVSPGDIVPMKTFLDSALTRSRNFLPPSRGQFVPHVNVASKKVRKDAFETAWAELQNKEFEGVWRATELTVLLFENNQQWVEVERFPLQGGADARH